MQTTPKPIFFYDIIDQKMKSEKIQRNIFFRYWIQQVFLKL